MIRSIIGKPSLAPTIATRTPDRLQVGEDRSYRLPEEKLLYAILIRALQDYLYVRVCQVSTRSRDNRYYASMDAKRWLYSEECFYMLEALDLPKEATLKYVLKISKSKDPVWLKDQIASLNYQVSYFG